MTATLGSTNGPDLTTRQPFRPSIGPGLILSGGALEAPPKTKASGETCDSHFPILPIIIPHLHQQVKEKTYIHRQIVCKAKKDKRLGDQNSFRRTKLEDGREVAPDRSRFAR